MLCSIRLGIRAALRITQPLLQSSPNSSRPQFQFALEAPVSRGRFFSSLGVEQPSSETPETQSLDEVVAKLCGDDAVAERRLRVLMLEVEVMRQDGRNAPNNMDARHWKNLLELPTKSQRLNYLAYLFKNEKSKENRKARQEERKMEYESKSKTEIEKENPDDMVYGLRDNALFLRIRDSSINSFDNYRAIQAMMFGQSLVIDCSYDDKMVAREAVNAAKQLTFVFGDNRIHRDPFNLHLCNVDPGGRTMKQLEVNIPIVNEPWFPLNIHTQSYKDIFPEKDLVYLTPHCRDELVEFDKEAVYIIGCMVDKANNEPLSLAKAKRDGIKMAKLPLDRHIEWAPGSGKCLNINHMVLILLDLKLTGDWNYALRHIPRRKLMETKIQAVQKNMSKFNPKFIDSLKSRTFNNKPKYAPRNYNGNFSNPKFTSRTYNDKKLSVKSLFDEDGKY